MKKENEKSLFLRALEDAIKEIKLTSYHQQYKDQIAMSGVRKRQMKLKDGLVRPVKREQTRLRQYKMSLHVDMEFIHKSKRLDFKRSDLNGKELTMYDVSKAYDIMKYNFMVFINDHLVDYVTVKPVLGNSYTELFIQIVDNGKEGGIQRDEIRKLIKEDATVTVYFIPNAEYGLYRPEYKLLSDNKERLSLGDMVDIDAMLEDPESYLVFVDDNSLYTKSNLLSEEKAELVKFNEDGRSHINIFGLRHIKEIKLVEDNFFRIDGTDMPVPKENMIVFKVEEQGQSFAYDIDIKQYYPNVYELTNTKPDTVYAVYVFYFPDEMLDTTPYFNELSVYEKYMHMRPEDYMKGGIIHEYAKNYQADDFSNYSIPDFLKSETDDSTLYKIIRFNDWSMKNPRLLKLFLKYQVEKGDQFTDGFYIPVKYVDLESKIRHDNYEEVKNSFQRVEFDEPHYLFIIRMDEKVDTVSRFYIDGEFYVSDKQWDIGQYTYHYIPTSKINPDTVIEVEKFRSASMSESIRFLRIRDTKIVRFGETNNSIRRNDLFMVSGETGKFIPREDYKISIQNAKTGNWTELPDNSFEFIPNGSFRVNLTNPEYLGQTIYVYFLRSAFMIQKHIEKSGAKDTFAFIAKYNNDVRQIRVFRNGRLLNQSLYNIGLPERYGGKTTVNPGIMKHKGDHYVVDVTPNHYNVIYSMKSIPKHGVIDLRGEIPKPVDLKWYDIYVNGKKLSYNDVEIISPLIIAIRNTKSLRNLIILERNDERAMSMVNEDMKSPIESLYDIDDEFKRRVLGEYRNNADIEEDIITEVVTALDIEMSRVVSELLKFVGFINPNEPQVNTEWSRELPELMGGGVSIMLNGNGPTNKKNQYIPIDANEDIDWNQEDDAPVIIS